MYYHNRTWNFAGKSLRPLSEAPIWLPCSTISTPALPVTIVKQPCVSLSVVWGASGWEKFRNLQPVVGPIGTCKIAMGQELWDSSLPHRVPQAWAASYPITPQKYDLFHLPFYFFTVADKCSQLIWHMVFLPFCKQLPFSQILRRTWWGGKEAQDFCSSGSFVCPVDQLGSWNQVER